MPQVSKEHYFKDYDRLHRFMHYWMQIEEAEGSILEIGCGNKTIYNYLKHNGTDIETFDFAEDLEPTHLGDVRKMDIGKKYDTIFCCEVLEHIPLKDVPAALDGLYKHAKKKVVISVPQYYAMCEIGINFNIILFRFFKGLRLRMPYFFTKPKFSGEHYWGLGQKGISKKTLRKMIKKAGFKIEKEKFIPMHQDLCYFILHKQQQTEK